MSHLLLFQLWCLIICNSGNMFRMMNYLKNMDVTFDGLTDTESDWWSVMYNTWLNAPWQILKLSLFYWKHFLTLFLVSEENRNRAPGFLTKCDRTLLLVKSAWKASSLTWLLSVNKQTKFGSYLWHSTLWQTL